MEAVMSSVYTLIVMILAIKSTKAAGINLAFNKTAYQYNVRSGGVPSRAVDGKNSGTGDAAGSFSHGSCAAMDARRNLWYGVDLKEEYNITDVAIVNRVDSTKSEDKNMRNFDIVVSNVKPPPSGPLPDLTSIRKVDSICLNRTLSMPKGGPTELACTKYVQGRYVYIIFRGNPGNIYICEFYVYGGPATTATTNSATAPTKDSNVSRGNGLSALPLSVIMSIALIITCMCIPYADT